MASLVVEQNVQIRLAVLEERHRGEAVAYEIFKEYMERRLADLNGEAGRIKTVLDHSVAKEVFDNYVAAQRDKVDAAANSQAMKFEVYEKTTEKRLATINTRMAMWIGGGAMFIAMLEFYMKYAGR